MASVIWKLIVPNPELAGSWTVMVPKNATTMVVGKDVEGRPAVWIDVSPEEEKEPKTYQNIYTGQPVPQALTPVDGKQVYWYYCGMYTYNGLVVHVYEKDEWELAPGINGPLTARLPEKDPR